MRCDNCGAESQPAELTVCSVCGARLARRWQREARCLNCGHYVNAASRVCPSCGASLPGKAKSWGVALLCLLAAAAIIYDVQRLGLGQETLSAIRRAPAAAISRVSEWRKQLFAVEWEEEGAPPTPSGTRAP